ncbi:MAG: PilZ domain-containing protein [Pseudomonadota bacterium]
MSQNPPSRDQRYKVHLQVRYGSAMDFVEEYAENLSRGGLFVAGAQSLSPRQEVTIEICLPGAGAFRIKAEVAHILGEEAARTLGRRPGAGLAITDAPPGFADELSRYLMRLGRRHDTVVIVGDARCSSAIAKAGYQVLPLPPPDELTAAIARCEQQVVAVLVPQTEVAFYAPVASIVGADDLLFVVDPSAAVDDILARLDERL